MTAITCPDAGVTKTGSTPWPISGAREMGENTRSRLNGRGILPRAAEDFRGFRMILVI
jgi:hypothetical protein